MKRNYKLIHKGQYTRIFKFTNASDDTIVRKLSIYPGNKKLFDEAEFIEKALPPSTERYFPEIIYRKKNYSKEKYYFFDMPYYRGTILRKKIVSLSTCEDELINDIKNALLCLKSTLYTRNASISPDSFLTKYYISRINRRIGEFKAKNKNDAIKDTENKISNLSKSEVSSIFCKIFSKSAVTVNGAKLLAPLEILKLFSQDINVRKVILPSQISMTLIHGDPHMGNILITHNDPIFLDPNGFSNGGDIAYDIGKIILSLDLLDCLYENQIISPTITLCNEEIKIGKLKIFRNFKMQERISNIYRIVVDDIIPDVFRENIKSDPMLVKRSIFVSNLHAIACAHTFIQNKTAISLHLLFYHLIKINSYIDDVNVDG